MKNKKTFLLITLGVALLMIGFFCLAQGPANNPISLTVAPIILVFAYLIVIPIGILWGSKDSKTKGDQLSWFRAAALQAAGQRFESVIAHTNFWGGSSIWLEHRPVTPEVASSSLVYPVKSPLFRGFFFYIPFFLQKISKKRVSTLWKIL